MSAITHVFAGVPVSDLDTSIDWYTRFFGRSPERRVRHEVLWEIDEHAWPFIEPNAAQAGTGRITSAASGLDRLLGRLAAKAQRKGAGEDLLQRCPPCEGLRPGRKRDRAL